MIVQGKYDKDEKYNLLKKCADSIIVHSDVIVIHANQFGKLYK